MDTNAVQKAALLTAAEARRQVIENLDSDAQNQFNTIAEQIENAVAKGQVFLTTNISVLHSTVLAKLKSLGYRIEPNYYGYLIISWE